MIKHKLRVIFGFLKSYRIFNIKLRRSAAYLVQMLKLNFVADYVYILIENHYQYNV